MPRWRFSNVASQLGQGSGDSFLGFTKMKQLTRRVAREGARVVVGGHTEVPFAARGEAPWREMELLVESGFSPLEAITAATSHRRGVPRIAETSSAALRAGFAADLVVLRGQPDREISAIRNAGTGDGCRPMDRHGDVPAVLKLSRLMSLT